MREIDKDGEIDRKRETEREKERESQRERQRWRDRQRETEREKEKERCYSRTKINDPMKIRCRSLMKREIVYERDGQRQKLGELHSILDI